MRTYPWQAMSVAGNAIVLSRRPTARHRLHVWSSLLCAGMLSTACLAAASQVADVGAETGGLSEITITAEKYSSTIQETPISISALSGDDLAAAFVTRDLVVGEALGAVPDHAPPVPLDADLRARARALKLKIEPGRRDGVRGYVVRTGGRVLDPATDSFIVELLGSEADINGFMRELANHGELIEVVRLLEQGGLDLDTSLALWERGEQLAKRCEEHLAGARKRVSDALAAREPDDS